MSRAESYNLWAFEREARKVRVAQWTREICPLGRWERISWGNWCTSDQIN